MRDLPIAAGTFNSTYWSTIAQVIPVLFILLAVEYRYFHHGSESEDESVETTFFLLTFLALLGSTEVIAIVALAGREEPSNWLQAIVFFAFAWALVGAFMRHVFPRLEALAIRVGELLTRILVLGGLVAVLTVGLLAGLDVVSPDLFYGVVVGVPFVAWSLSVGVRLFGTLGRRADATNEGAAHVGSRVSRLLSALFVGWVLVSLRRRRRG